jgi:hypothetical protein
LLKKRKFSVHQYFQVVLLVIMVFMLSSCAATSDNNLAEDPFNAWGGGGGYLVREVSKGTFEIEGRTNGTLLANYGAARNMWEKQAKKACPSGYVEKDIEEYTFPQPGTGINQHSVKKGLAICK